MKKFTYRNYLIFILLLISAFNYVDRLALGLVLEDIKHDLQLSDTQLGFLTGLAFALFYSLMGIPLARWADRGNRVTIVTFTTVLWSIAVAFCAAASSFAQLLLIRIGIAVGEAGCLPTAHSLIADHFGRAERPRAVARYMLGVPLSVVIGYFIAGWLNELYGWRTMFIILSLPGVALALVAYLTLREPRLAKPGQEAAPELAIESGPESPDAAAFRAGFRYVVTALVSNLTFRHLLACFSVQSFFSYGILQWKPAFFIRSHGLDTGELGTWFTLIYGVGGLIGTLAGGEWATRFAARDERFQLKTIALLYCGFAIVSIGIYVSTSHYVAFALMAMSSVFASAAAVPMFAILQTLVAERMRATSIATIYLFANLIGMGLGPLVAGALSDALRPAFGEESLKYSLIALSPGYFWGAWHVWRARRTVVEDLAKTQTENAAAEGEIRPESRLAGAA